MRPAWLALVLAGCVASEAAPPFGGGSAAPAAAAWTCDDCSLAECEAETASAGRVCIPNDSPYTLVARASAWAYYWPGIGWAVTKPPSSSWTAFNSGAITAPGDGTRLNTVAASATGTLRGEYRTQPALPFQVDACFDLGPVVGTNGGVGVGLGGTDGTGVAQIWVTDWNGTLSKPGAAVSRWSAHTTFVASDYDVALTPQRIVCLRYVDDDSPAERRFYFVDPNNGLVSANAIQVGAGLGRTVTITATNIGWWAATNDADVGRNVRLVHWATSAL